MKLEELWKDIPGKTMNFQNKEITYLSSDSRDVIPETLFFCIPGITRNGYSFAEDAERKGAVAFICERPIKTKNPVLIVEDAITALHSIAKKFYGSFNFPLIGITGTNGKTTSASLISFILEKLCYKVGLIGTVTWGIGSQQKDSFYTTPPALSFYKALKEFQDNKVSYGVIEVTSHGLKQRRVEGILFDSAIWTNLSRDHLDFHPSMEDYYESKKRLFNLVKRNAIINISCPWGKRLYKEITGCKTIGFGTREGTYRGKMKHLDLDGMTIEIEYPGNKTVLRTKLLGEPNLFNILGVFALMDTMGFPTEKIIKGIEEFQGVKGRMERVRDYKIFIDYAHTPDALQSALLTLRKLETKKLIVVFGAGGNRDKAKRPLMGKVASTFADYIFVTSDNPRFEDPEEIIHHILQGIEDKNAVEVVVDRKSAIKRALEFKNQGTILIAGKGHEAYQEIQGKRYPFDDRKVVEELLG